MPVNIHRLKYHLLLGQITVLSFSFQDIKKTLKRKKYPFQLTFHYLFTIYNKLWGVSLFSFTCHLCTVGPTRVGKEPTSQLTFPDGCFPALQRSEWSFRNPLASQGSARSLL